MRLWKRLGRQRWVQATIGISAAEYLRFVANTNRIIIEPESIYDRIADHAPVIVALWHGHHGLVPCLRRAEQRFKVLISRHRDGEINAIASEYLGVPAIRGSGDHGKEFHRKGGVGAFREILAALAQGYHVTLTADVPKVSRVAGLGIVKLAQLSGRPIYPLAIMTSRRIELATWDKSVINLPFGRLAAVAGAPIRVAPDAAAEALEQARLAVENGLNAATARAYALADKNADLRADGHRE
jgi:hypothetical protein